MRAKSRLQRRIAMLVMTACIVGALAALLANGPADSYQSGPERVFDLDPARVRALSLRAHDRLIRLEREDTGWWIVAPSRTLADPQVLAEMLTFLSRLRRFTEGVNGDRDRFGLDSPRFEVKIEARARTDRLRVGDRSQFSGHVYVDRGPGSSAFLIDARVLDVFDRSAFQLRDRRLVPCLPTAIAALSVKGPGGAAILRRAERVDGGFVLDDGERLDPHAVRAALEQVTSARAARPVDREVVDGGADSGWRWEFEVDEATTYTVELWSLDNPRRYVAHTPSLGLVELATPVLHRRLEGGLVAMRDQRVFPIAVSKVRVAAFGRSGRGVEVQQTDLGWVVRASAAGSPVYPADSDRVRSFIYSLSKLRRESSQRAPTQMAWQGDDVGEMALGDEEAIWRYRWLVDERGQGWLRSVRGKDVFAFDPERLGTLSAEPSRYRPDDER